MTWKTPRKRWVTAIFLLAVRAEQDSQGCRGLHSTGLPGFPTADFSTGQALGSSRVAVLKVPVQVAVLLGSDPSGA